MAIASYFHPRVLIGGRLLQRGESLIAAVGIAAVAIVLATMSASAWWTVREQQSALEEMRLREVRALGHVLSRVSETMLAADEVSALRRLLIEAQADHGLMECRILLPSGEVLADAEPARITRAALPERWESGPLDAQIPEQREGIIHANNPLTVPGRGSALLVLSASSHVTTSNPWETQAGIGMIGVVGVLAMLLVYRQMRARLQSLAMIRSAVLSSGAGVADSDALTITAPGGGAEVASWNAMVAEITSLRRKTMAQQTTETRGGRRGKASEFEQAFDALTQGVIILNQQEQIVYANGAAAVCLRKKRDDLWNKPVAAFLPNDQIRNAVNAVTHGAARPRAAVEVEHRDEQSGGVLCFAVRPLWRDGVCGGLITINDVTQQRVADDARNAFIAQATHELRMPLTNMRLYLDVVVDETSDPALRAKGLNVIGQECRRLEHMVSEMLSVAQIEAGSLELNHDDIRLTKLLEELEADYSTTAAEKKLTLRFTLPPKLPTIQGDREKFALALHNLIGNAIKYSPEGGGVTVSATAENKILRIDVADTGIGVPEDEQERIFERFYRAKDARTRKITGTGLGLTLAREVARLHGGDITLQSQPGKGSTFTLSIPIIETAD